MGDIRQTFRYVVPALVDAGYRVATFDIRGHGDSDTTFTSFDDDAEASDLIALIEHLGGPAAVVGVSMGAAAGVIAAAERPDLITGLALVSAFVRQPKTSVFTRVLMRVATEPLWAAPMWKAYLPSLYAGTKPADQKEFAAQANAAMRRRGYATTFSKTSHSKHDPAERALPGVTAPTLVVMGELDPDFSTSTTEAAWIAEQLSATVVMVPDAGHYPQSQHPEIVGPAITAFLSTVHSA
jgi:pimeloyl-ACP methyl ester carboxylesterase